MTDDERKAEDIRRKKVAAFEKAQEKIMKDRMTMIGKIKAIWTGLYSTLTVQLSRIFGVQGDAAQGIDNVGKMLKEALSLSSLEEDVKKGNWATAIGDRLKKVTDTVLKKFFPTFAKEVEKHRILFGNSRQIHKSFVTPKIVDALNGIWKGLFPKLTAEIER